jgi:glutamate--cysteine ligase catalytic subunit
LTANIRNRKGSKVAIHIPLFKDEATPNTPLPMPPKDGKQEQKPQLFADEQTQNPNDIYMDSMAFGMGCCCLQATFQACTIREARFLYDQLAVMSPLLVLSIFTNSICS